MYEYKAFCERVIDGDTVEMRVDVGFEMQQVMKFRLIGINTPEIVGKRKLEAIAAKEFVEEKILKKRVSIKTFKDKKEKYGRYLAHIILDDGSSLNQLLIDNGLAEAYFMNIGGENEQR